MLEVLYEDNHCLAINKPAGMLSQADDTGDECIVDLAREYLRTKYAKPGNVFVGLVHRLDRPTSGVVLLSRTSKGAERLCRQFREGTINKVYLAVIEGVPAEASGQFHDRLWKDESRNIVKVVGDLDPRGQEAIAKFERVASEGGLTLVELRPKTGRSHQLRVQLSSRGLPIVGDAKYGAQRPLKASDGHPRIALHAHTLIFQHPTRPEAITITAPLPSDWPSSPGLR